MSEDYEDTDLEVEGGEESAEAEYFELPSEGKIKTGDYDEPFEASEFRTRYIPQSEYDKQLARAQQRYEQQAQQYVAQQQQQLQYQYQQAIQQQQQQQQQQQFQGPTGRVLTMDEVVAAAEGRAYVAPEDLKAAIQHFGPVVGEVQGLKDTLTLAMQRLQYTQQIAESLQNQNVQQQTEKYIQQIQKTDPLLDGDWGREVVMDVLNSYQPKQGEGIDEFIEEVTKICQGRAKGALGQAETYKKSELERARSAQRAGIASAGGQGVPTGKTKMPLDPEDFVKMFSGRGG